MKTLLMRVLWLVVPLAAVMPVNAQTLWRAPMGKFSLVIPEGWQSIPLGDVETGAKSTADLLITPTPEAKALAEIGCSVFRLNHTAPAEVNQLAANDVLQDWDKNRVVSEASRGRSNVIDLLNFKNEVRDGVRTASANYVLKSGTGKRVVWQSQFMLALGGSKVGFFTFSCFVPEPEKGPEFSRAAKTFESLRFGGADSQ